MRILAVYRHYWPDVTPYARLLRSMLEEFAAVGHSVSVFTAQPSYNDVTHQRQPALEELNGVEIYRCSLLPERKRWTLLRAINFSIFLMRAVWHVFRHRDIDLIIANTHPPVLMGWTLRVMHWLFGIPFIIHCQDIHPESAQLAGQLRSPWLIRRLRAIDHNNCTVAKCVVTLSDDMRQTLSERGTGPDVRVINNFPLDRYHAQATLPAIFQEAAPENESPFRVLFAGNIGQYQRLEQLVAAAHQLAGQTEIQFIFMGAGSARQSLRDLAGDLLDKTVFFEDFLPVETAFACMQSSHLGIISLSPGLYRVAYPSKTMTYLAAGCPVLALVEPESNLAHEVINHGFGTVPHSLDPVAIAQAIRQAYETRDQWTPTARQELADRAEAHYGRDRAILQWKELFDDLFEIGNEHEVIEGAEIKINRAA
ncbi:MAG: glycosyltransferase family 4 protein [Planctomycetaceae bacterium]